jgi:DNA-3-methyladenine glycosylase II
MKRDPRPRPGARAAARALALADPDLGRLIRKVGPCRLSPHAIRSPFASLARAIVYQQLNGRAAAAIHARFVDLFSPARFPSPDDLLMKPDEALRSAGLSRAKVRALKDLAAKIKDGTVPPLRRLRRMDEEAIVERLTQVRGIGRWTVEMLLIFGLERPDVLPAGDFGNRRGFHVAFGTRGLPTPRQVLRRGERWKPHRTVASWYLWRALD